MARSTWTALLCACLALLAINVQARVPSGTVSDNSVCDSCLWSVHLLEDLLCDEYIDTQAVTWVVKNVCSQMGENKDTCIQLVTGLFPAFVDWVRASATPETMCANVCPNTASYKALMQAAAVRRTTIPMRQANDMACPLCMFVVVKVKEALHDPATQEDIHTKSLQACNALPEGGMRQACITFVEQYETVLFQYINLLQPAEMCQMMGTCLAQARPRYPAIAPMRPAAAAQLQRVMTLVRAPPANDNCETCKIVVQEVRGVIANPEMQAQIVEYAKQACGLVASFAEQCKADVDQYAPMAFGMILAYMQPLQVCAEIHMCPAPSMQQQLDSITLLNSLTASKLQYSALKHANIRPPKHVTV